VLIAVLAATTASLWSGLTHSMTLYGDAAGHLDVARRVTDGLRMGLTQLGSVWLPLPQLLLVPLASVRGLWHSGVAGAVVSGVCFVYTGTRIYSLVKELSGSAVGAWCAFAVFTLNLNMLYVQTTALTEPVLLAFCVGSVYHLARWMRTFSIGELTWAGVLITCAVLSRYEGWAVLAVEAGVVALWGLLVDRRRASAQANFLLFTIIGAYGVALWFLYNLIIFHDPLYFLHSLYSAQAINGEQARYGLLGTKGHLGKTILTYGWDIVGVIGPVVLIAGLLGAVLLAKRDRERRRTLFVLAILATPVVFLIAALYAGQITIRVPQLAPHEMWNDRYGLVALPLFAVALGCVAARSRHLAALALTVVVAATVVMSLGTPLTVADGRLGISSARAGHPALAATYLHRHYRGGEILADDRAAAPLMFESGLDLAQYVSPGFHPYWERALAAPARHVEWVVAYPGDAVSSDIAAHPARFVEFRRVLTDLRGRLYRREGELARAMRDAGALHSVALYELAQARVAVYLEEAIEQPEITLSYEQIRPISSRCAFAGLRAGAFGADYTCVSKVYDAVANEVRMRSDSHVRCAAARSGPVRCTDGIPTATLSRTWLRLRRG
jgi:hypothetical protein